MSYSAGRGRGGLWAKGLWATVVCLGAHTALAEPHFTLTWKDNATGETAVVVERQRCCGEDWQRLPSLAANTVTWVDTPVTPGVTACYRVRACDATQCSLPSNTVCVAIPQGGK